MENPANQPTAADYASSRARDVQKRIEALKTVLLEMVDLIACLEHGDPTSPERVDAMIAGLKTSITAI